MTKLIVAFICIVWGFNALAGVDKEGKIERVWMDESDRFWFKIDNASVDEYCKPQWFGFNLYILKSDKDFPYYYGLITSAHSSGLRIRVSNIGIFDGQTACDIAQTGFGIVVHAP